MIRDAQVMLERIDAVAEQYEGLDRVCFYARVAALLSEHCGDRSAIGVDWSQFEELLISASIEAEQEAKAAGAPPSSFRQFRKPLQQGAQAPHALSELQRRVHRALQG